MFVQVTIINKLSIYLSILKSLFLVYFFETLFPGSFKGWQITQKLTRIKHVDLFLASNVLLEKLMTY